MAGTLYFVHGTGVRQGGLDATLAAVKDGVRRNNVPAADVRHVAWGPRLGVALDRIAASLPPGAATRDAFGGGPAPTGEDVEVARWSLLLDDPLFELRVAGTAPSSGGGIAVGTVTADQAAAQNVRSAVDRLDGADELAAAGLATTELEAAAGMVADSPELAQAALAAGSAGDPELVDAAARAVVAAALAGHRLDEPGTEPAAALNGGIRDELVDRLADAIMPAGTRGLATDWLKKKVVEFANKKASNVAVSRRADIMGGSMPAIGDILFYQRRGEQILDLVAAGLEGLPRPVVAVGHSLGGVVLVDLLTRAGAPTVDLLVTAGSQSPLFYAIDALGSLRPGNARPTAPPAWLNIFNPQDLLAFYATAVFPGIAGIHDERVDPGVPFPASHSAYWHDDRVYGLIRDHWPTG
jgi:hypothetical protein